LDYMADTKTSRHYLLPRPNSSVPATTFTSEFAHHSPSRLPSYNDHTKMFALVGGERRDGREKARIPAVLIGRGLQGLGKRA
jgi:hypothetical protein